MSIVRHHSFTRVLQDVVGRLSIAMSFGRSRRAALFARARQAYVGRAGRPEDRVLLGADDQMGVVAPCESIYFQTLVSAGLADLARPVENLSASQSAALAATGSCSPVSLNSFRHDLGSLLSRHRARQLLSVQCELLRGRHRMDATAAHGSVRNGQEE